MKFLFLDFDGVLHSHYGRDSALWTFLPRFESVMRDYPQALVVISSSWGDRRSIDELRELFSPDIRPRVIDKIRTVVTRIGGSERGVACRNFCRRHKLRAGDWIAIDDDMGLFGHKDPVIRCMTGFRDGEELLLRMVLAEEIPAWRFAFETVESLFYRLFDRDAERARGYVMAHRAEVGGGATLSQLLFARRRHAVQRQARFLEALYMRSTNEAHVGVGSANERVELPSSRADVSAGYAQRDEDKS